MADVAGSETTNIVTILLIIEQEEESPVTEPTPPPLKTCLTKDVLDEVREEILNDPCQPPMLKEAIAKVTEQLVEELRFLDACFPLTAYTFSVEQAWLSFHRSVPTSSSFTSPQLLTWVALKVFKKVILKYRSSVSNKLCTDIVDVNLSSEENDVIYHIAGFVVSRLKKRLSQKSYHLSILQQLTSDHNPRATLTTILDRGGLCYVTDATFDLFMKFEFNFRNLCNEDVTKLTFDTFAQNVSADDSIASSYANIYNQLAVPSGVADEMLLLMLQLFFKTRAHGRCRQMVETMKAKAKVKKSRKALRDELS